MEIEDFDTILREQNNKCPICLKDLVKPHVDHCHASNKVRGILCCGCNTSLGVFDDSPEILRGKKMSCDIPIRMVLCSECHQQKSNAEREAKK